MAILKPTIFLSHSSADQDLLRRLREFLLRRTGATIEVFLSSDGQSIPFGKNWVREVEEGLERAQVMFTFLSPIALQSQWVLFEAGFAYAKKIQVIPVGILGIDLARVPPPLSLLQGFNLREAPSLGNLLAIINRALAFSHLEHCTDEEFRDVFSAASKSELSVLGEFGSLVDELVFEVDCTTTIDVQWIESNLIERGVRAMLSRSEITAHGLSISKQGNLVEIRADPMVTQLTFPILQELIPKMAGEQFSGYNITVTFRRPIRCEDRRHTVTARLLKENIELAERGGFQLLGIQFTPEQKYETTGSYEIPTCSGLHYLDARLALMAPFRPTIIDSVRCSRPTLSAPEPRLLILGSQSCLVGSHS